MTEDDNTTQAFENVADDEEFLRNTKKIVMKHKPETNKTYEAKDVIRGSSLKDEDI